MTTLHSRVAFKMPATEYNSHKVFDPGSKKLHILFICDVKLSKPDLSLIRNAVEVLYKEGFDVAPIGDIYILFNNKEEGSTDFLDAAFQVMRDYLYNLFSMTRLKLHHINDHLKHSYAKWSDGRVPYCCLRDTLLNLVQPNDNDYYLFLDSDLAGLSASEFDDVTKWLDFPLDIPNYLSKLVTAINCNPEASIFASNWVMTYKPNSTSK
ncbi:hypothetical protein P9112_014308 [Eukaryota sp. TZLM1-RC]